MKKLFLLVLLVAITLSAQIKIGYETTVLPHFENDFDFTPDVQHKLMIGNDYLSVFVGYVPIRQTLSKEKTTEIIDVLTNYKVYSLTQTYFSDQLNYGVQSNPANWFGIYVGIINGGKIELSNKYESSFNITKETGIQFGFVLTPRITENLYIGMGTGWNSISSGSQFSIQTMLNI